MATSIERQSQSLVYTNVRSRRNMMWAAAGLALFVGAVSIVAWQSNQDSAAQSEQGELEQSSASAPDPDDALEAKPVPVPDATLEREKTTAIRVAATPINAEIYIDGVRLGVGEARAELALGETERMLRVQADGYVTKEISFSTEPPPFVVRLDPEPKEVASSDGDTNEARTGTRDPSKRSEPRKPRPRKPPKDSTDESKTGQEPDAPVKKPDEDRDPFEGKTDNLDPFAD